MESYFVWIPRYAYKITYNADKTGGTIDVKFLVGTSDNYYDENGVLQKAERIVTGQEDTTNNYYVHPAFTNNVDLGGWDTELTGIWVGKYETSLVDTTDKNNITNVVTDDEGTENILLSDVENRAVAVQEGMSSWRNITIENMYTNAKSYAENLNSHMLKNSEWGAVAYLTHSQYGRNGTEVGVNSKEYITAEGDILESKSQSSTGNVYGIYDLRGGATERVSSYLENGNDANGEVLANEVNKKFVTFYKEISGEIGYKQGDATYETKNWHSDSADSINLNNPFFLRGGSYINITNAGVFKYSGIGGNFYNDVSFRMCLIVK